MENLNVFTDDMLVARYQEGDDKAFDELLARYQDKLYNYILFNVRNQELAEDVFQETFVKAIVNLQQGRYQPDGKFSAWITRIAHNLVIDLFRQERNENLISNDESEVDLLNSAKFSEGTIESQMVNKQVLKDVARLVDELPEAQREVVRMRFFENKSFKEIAESEGISINTALGHVRYAISNMRRIAAEKRISLALEF